MPQVLSAVKAVIKKGDTFLILKFIKNDFSIWDLPGGRIKYKDSPLDALKREVKEETNLGIDILKSIGVWWFYPSHIKDVQVVCHTFLCKPLNDNVDLSKNPEDEEHTDFRWVTKKGFLNSDEYSNVSDSLKELISGLTL